MARTRPFALRRSALTALTTLSLVAVPTPDGVHAAATVPP